MGAPLLMRPQPLAGEGLRGYFLRLADANELLPIVDLFRRAFGGIGLAGVSRGRLQRVADDLGLDTGALHGLGCRGMSSDPARCHHRGHRIAAQHLRGSQCAVCPLCLAACAAVRADWELVAQVVCPHHVCWLVDRCSRCGRPIAWRRRAVRTCLCGQDLALLRTRPADRDAIEYGRVVARRLFGDLEPVDGPRVIPVAITSAPLNQLLGLVHLLRNTRFRVLAADMPNLPNCTPRLRGQIATVCTVGSVLADWPRRWHNALDQVAGAVSPPEGSQRRIVSVEQARAPFVALQRGSWSAAADFPHAFRAELANYLGKRSVRVGSRRYYTEGPRPDAEPTTPARLKHLWAPGFRGAAIGAEDLLSAEAVRDLFDASPSQMRALQRVGILPEHRQWLTAQEVDAGFERLTRWTSSRPSGSTGRFAAFRDVGFMDCGDAELALRRVMSGETPTVTWTHVRPSGLGNLFVPVRKSVQGAERSQRSTSNAS